MGRLLPDAAAFYGSQSHPSSAGSLRPPRTPSRRDAGTENGSLFASRPESSRCRSAALSCSTSSPLCSRAQSAWSGAHASEGQGKGWSMVRRLRCCSAGNSREQEHLSLPRIPLSSRCDRVCNQKAKYLSRQDPAPLARPKTAPLWSSHSISSSLHVIGSVGKGIGSSDSIVAPDEGLPIVRPAGHINVLQGGYHSDTQALPYHTTVRCITSDFLKPEESPSQEALEGSKWKHTIARSGPQHLLKLAENITAEEFAASSEQLLRV
jgi:hypothetical protein